MSKAAINLFEFMAGKRKADQYTDEQRVAVLRDARALVGTPGWSVNRALQRAARQHSVSLSRLRDWYYERKIKRPSCIKAI